VFASLPFGPTQVWVDKAGRWGEAEQAGGGNYGARELHGESPYSYAMQIRFHIGDREGFLHVRCGTRL